MKLIDVSKHRAAVKLLWRLLNEREPVSRISSKALPTFEEHNLFVRTHPYFAWYLLETEDKGFVGSIYHGHDNSIGVAIFKEYQGQGYGRAAVLLLMEEHRPLPAKKSVRNGNFIANISPGNRTSARFFMRLGFKKIQETYAF